MGNFAQFNLSKEMVLALEKLGYKEPSPVQSRVIPKALRGDSILCQSETGSGKTHSYLIPIIDRLDLSLPRLQSIVICPSRELARQVYDFAFAFTRYFPKLKVRLFTSSEEKSENQQGLSIAPQLVIGTPGRLKDLLADDYELNLKGVKSLVLDEADMLMDMGYFEDIDALRSLLRDDLQVMVFSATLEQGLKEKLRKYAASDFLYQGEDNKSSANVSHHLVDIKHAGKNEALLRFLSIKVPYLALVFASKKEDVNSAYAALKNAGYSVVLFSGDLETRERRKTIRMIKENRYQVVVCSDLLSRGIDIEDVSDVISLDLPNDLNYYHHRAGRTARFGKSGDSWVFYDDDSTKLPKALMEQGVKFDFLILKKDGLENDPVGLLPKTKFKKKKPFEDPEEAKEIKIAKANTRAKKVKPGYKRKQRWAVEKVKNKYRRKAIRKKIRANLHGKEQG